MNVAYRNEGDVQPAGSDRGQMGVVAVTATRVASSKTTTAFVQAVRFVLFIDRDNWLFPVVPLPPTAWRACLDYMAPRAATAGRGDTLPGQYRRLLARHSPNGRYLYPRGPPDAGLHRAHGRSHGAPAIAWESSPGRYFRRQPRPEQAQASCDSGAPADGRRRHRRPTPASPGHRGADHDHRRPARSVHPCWGLGRLQRQVPGNMSAGSCHMKNR
jgi:hypothetical protein